MIKQIVINKTLLNYEQVGDKSDTNLVFLHGWRCDSAIWQQVVSSIDEPKMTIYLLDLPGFGGSVMSGAAMDISDYVDVVSGFIEKLKLKNVVLVGHSVGGRIAIKFAATKPTELAKLVLIDSAGFVQKRKSMEVAAKIVKPFFAPSFMKGPREFIYKAIGAEDYVATPQLKETFVNIINEDLGTFLKDIKAPTLIFWGGDDKDTPLEFGERMNSSITGSRLVVFPGVGHYSFLERPMEFTQKLLTFIKE